MAIPSTFNLEIRLEHMFRETLSNYFIVLFKKIENNITFDDLFNKLRKRDKNLADEINSKKYILISSNYIENFTSYDKNEFISHLSNPEDSTFYIVLVLNSTLQADELRLSMNNKGLLRIVVSPYLEYNRFKKEYDKNILIKLIKHELIHFLDTQSKLYNRFYKGVDNSKNYIAHPYEVVAYSSSIIGNLDKNKIYNKNNINNDLKQAIYKSDLPQLMIDKILSDSSVFYSYRDVIIDTLIKLGRYEGSRPFSQKVRTIVNPIKYTIRGLIGK